MEITNPVPSCRRPDKITYPTRRAAHKARRRLNARHLSAYKCLGCGLWHLGNSSAYEREQIRERGE